MKKHDWFITILLSALFWLLVYATRTKAADCMPGIHIASRTDALAFLNGYWCGRESMKKESKP